MKNQVLILLLVSTASLLAGCATTLKNLGDYQSAPMMEADVVPSLEQMESKRSKVVVFDGPDRGSPVLFKLRR